MKYFIDGLYFLIFYKNYDKLVTKDLSEFYSNEIDGEVIEIDVKLWRIHLEKLSEHAWGF